MGKIYLFAFMLFLAFSSQAQMYLPLPGKLPMEKIQQMGMRLSESELLGLAHGAVVHFKGCSGAFVSKDGLFGTNHHCAEGFCLSPIQAAHPDGAYDKLLQDGFIAAKQEAELKCPGGFVRILSAARNVSKHLIPLEKTPGDAFKNKVDALVAACQGNRADRFCQVASMDNQPDQPYELLQYEVLNDVRLAWMPPVTIGSFGGEVDNWHYPRYSGDFSFLRAYKDGRPYEPKHFAPPSRDGVKPGDALLIAGFPGNTDRNISSYEAGYLQEVEFATIHDTYLSLANAIHGIYKNPDESPYASNYGYLQNYITNFREKRTLMKTEDVVAQKKSKEDAFRQQNDLSGRTVKKLEKIFDRREDYFPALYLIRLMQDARRSPSRSLTAAFSYQNYLTAAPKDKARALETLKEKLNELATIADPKTETALLNVYLSALTEALGKIPALRALGQKTNVTTPLMAHVSLHTRFQADKNKVNDLLKSLEQNIHVSDDPMLNLVKSLKAIQTRLEKKRRYEKPYAKRLASLNREVNRAVQPETPDANSTLRFAFGTVQEAYTPIADPSKTYGFAVGLQGLIDRDQFIKDPNHPDYATFFVPKNVKDAAVKKQDLKETFAWDTRLNDVPVTFISDHVITGGNSGSGVFNADGEIVGFAFDGTPESILTDLWPHPQNRSIIVDIRYVAFLGMLAYPEAKWILEEMGLTP